MDQAVVEELIQDRLKAENLVFFLDKLLNDKDYIQKQYHSYKVLNNKLEGPGASQRAADKMYMRLNK